MGRRTGIALTAIDNIAASIRAAIDGDLIVIRSLIAVCQSAEYGLCKGKRHIINRDGVMRHRIRIAIPANDIPVDGRCIHRRLSANRDDIVLYTARLICRINPRRVLCRKIRIRRQNGYMIIGIRIRRRCVEHEPASCGETERYIERQSLPILQSCHHSSSS